MIAAFPIALFILGGVILLGLPVAFSLQTYYKNRGRRAVICPENRQPVEVEVDSKFAFRTALRGQEHTRLESCSRWPEMHECGQECLAQIDPTPENIERLLKKSYQGKACGICGRLLDPPDWEQGRLALLDENFRLVEMRQIELDQLQSAVDSMRPLCWKCHQDEKQRRVQPHRILKGERQPVRTAISD